MLFSILKTHKNEKINDSKKLRYPCCPKIFRYFVWLMLDLILLQTCEFLVFCVLGRPDRFQTSTKDLHRLILVFWIVSTWFWNPTTNMSLVKRSFLVKKRNFWLFWWFFEFFVNMVGLRSMKIVMNVNLSLIYHNKSIKYHFLSFKVIEYSPNRQNQKLICFVFRSKNQL